MRPLFVMLFYSRTCATRRNRLGVTIIELMVTLSLIAVLLMLAWPRWSAFKLARDDAQLKQQLIQTILQLRLAGLNANQAVTLCPSSDGLRCETRWTSGWLAYRGEHEKLFFTQSNFSNQQLSWRNVYHTPVVHFEPPSFMTNGQFVCTRDGKTVWTLTVSRFGAVR